MRLLLLVCTLFSSSVLVLYSPMSHAAKIKTAKHGLVQHTKHVQANKKGLKRLNAALPNPKYSEHPQDVWDRIRMGMQMYSLTDKFIFENKGEIAAKPFMVADIYQLLKEPAVQLRLYKFQRFNINVLKDMLKQAPPSAIKNTSPMHYAANKKAKHPKVLARANETAAALQQVSYVEPEPCQKKLKAKHAPKAVALKPSYLRSVVFLPTVEPSIWQHKAVQAEPQVEKLDCVKPVRSANVTTPKLLPGLKSLNYKVKAASLEQQEIANTRINRQIEWFAKRPDYLKLVAERARPFLFHIVDELARHKLPLELALLPIVESAYKPTAQSPMRAAGLWQFMPSTGKAFDLKQTGFYDDRLDVTASTHAAIRFLTQLSKHYNGDWLLALAAYNCGPGKVDAVRRQNKALGLPTDYWSLALPEETQNYVPRLLALANIFANPARYKIKVSPVKNEPYFIKVNIEGKSEAQLANKDLRTVAQLANLSYENFIRLNPGYLNETLAKKGPFNFIMPVGNAYQLQRQLDMMASNESDDPLQPYYRHASYIEPETLTVNKL